MIVRLVWGGAEATALLRTCGPIIVIDALRMSATVIVALHRGMTIVPVATAEEALRSKNEEGMLTAGERGGKKIAELDLGNSPTELLHQQGLEGRCLALTTSHGIPALLAVKDHAHPVLIGSPLNLGALVELIEQRHPPELALFLAGQTKNAAGEDAMTASLLLERLGVSTEADLPSPIPAADLEAFFLKTQSAARLLALGYEADVHFCAQVDRYPIVPEFRAGRIASTFPKRRVRPYTSLQE
jgi:2-phosphosulfolactate phosphatase